MSLSKRRGRKPGKKAFEAQAAARKNSHWLDCQECGLESREVDGNVTTFTCWKCTCSLVAWPAGKQPETADEKQARLERKAARVAKKEAIAAGTYVEPEKPGSLGFGRGWHRCVIFSAEVDGKEVYYTKGVKITKAQFTKLVAQHAEKHAVKPTAEFGRGWHFRKNFVAPNGDVYSMGKLASKATKQPDLTELQSLMEQHSS